MSASVSRPSRRRFLVGLAAASVAPAWAWVDELAWARAEPRFSGDDFEQAHGLLFKPDEVLGALTPQAHAESYDVIIVGGGIAGLVSAYRLRNRRTLLLEREPQVGGVSKGEDWQGIDYAIGAAYIIDPDPESEDPQERENFRLLEELGLRQRGEDLASDRSRSRRLGGEAGHCVFSNRRVVPQAEVYTTENRRFFEHVLESDKFPSVPPKDDALVQALDRVSFKRFLQSGALQQKFYGRMVGRILPLGWEAIEYYCYGAFATTAHETSAYHGLNFFAAEFGATLVYPGGNAYIARRMGERIAREAPQLIRSRTWVLRIERDGEHYDVIAWQQGKLHRFRTRSVIFSAPLFLAPAIIPGLSEAQRKAIATLRYRSYVVANVLLNRRVDQIVANPMLRDGYELTRVHGIDVEAVPAREISTRKVYSDAIWADYASGRHAGRAVLTVYRPYPYASGRAELLTLGYGQIEEEVRREILAGFGAHGLRSEDIEGVRLSRWGHPMLVARPGQLADGTLKSAGQSQPGLYFAHTDVQGAPAFENAVAAARMAVAAVSAHLGAA
jgi:predicted NAD/FAD-binding protein